MSNSLNSIRFNRMLGAVGLAVPVASLATACGTTSAPATRVGAALPGPTNVTNSSPIPSDTTAGTPDFEVETRSTHFGHDISASEQLCQRDRSQAVAT